MPAVYPRVLVLGSENRFVTTVHREQAERMITERQAVPLGSGRRLRAVSLIQPAPQDPGNYRGGDSRKTTFREHLGEGVTVIAHKRFPPGTAHLFRLAVTENLAA